jgi:hypothetical protein
MGDPDDARIRVEPFEAIEIEIELELGGLSER